jgi:Fur family transcriptional regulator, ferric uptake regulator
LEAVQTLEHATPDEILAYASERASGINVSTVYRTLDLLESLELVRHTHLAHGAPTYHSSAIPAHVHLVCRQCSGVTEVPPSTVAALVRGLSADLGFETDVNHLTVFGTCVGCRAGDTPL